MDDDNVIPFPPAETQASPRADQLVSAVEACLFAAAGVVGVAQLAGVLTVGEDAVEAALEELAQRQARTGAGVRAVAVAGGWQLRTEPAFGRWVAGILGVKPVRLSRAALETLAVVAFRQPVSKGEVDDLRGVDCGGVLRMLVDRGLVRAAGRSDEPGRPMAFGTTSGFLETFGMRSLADLPSLPDLRAFPVDDGRGDEGGADEGGADEGAAEDAPDAM